MKQSQFKTNINCGSCVAKVTPFLNEHPAIKNWKVDTSNPSKILSVETEGPEEVDVAALVKKAGFSAEKLS